jgi:hypothetical protein
MTWDEYIDEVVTDLTSCRTAAEFEQAIDAIHRELDANNATADFRDTVWQAITDRYRVAPKLILKEATAAAALFALANRAEAILQAARARK